MIILVDIGNSNIVIAQYERTIGETFRYSTDKTKSIDEYYVLIKDIIKGADGIIISSVVPQLNIIFKNLIEKYLNISPIFVGPGVKTGVRIIADNPKEAGADLVAAASAAIADYGDNVIVVDMGTATTFTYIENKIIKGVSITAGLVTQRDALIGNTSQLSQFEFKTPEKVIGSNTVDCLNSGLLYGHTFMIMGIIDAIIKENNNSPKVVITGGASRFIEDLLPKQYIIDDVLLLKGLVNIYNRNKR